MSECSVNNIAPNNTYRVLDSVSRILRNLMIDYSLGYSTCCSCIRHQLGVAGIVQAGEEESCFIDGPAHSQEPGENCQPRNKQSISFGII